MGRVILLVIIGLAAGFYFPDSRAVLVDKLEPLLRPMLTWNAQREMEEIASGIQEMENVERRIPAKREWVKWIEDHYTGDASKDPWGSVYGYEIQADSFAILSNGPDRTLKTEDDIRDVRIRNWKAMGRGNP